MPPSSINGNEKAETVVAGSNASRDPTVLGAPEILQRVLPTSSPARRGTVSLNEKTSDAEDASGDDFDLEAKLYDYQRQNTGHTKQKKLDVAWHDLYVRGVGANVQYGKTVGR